MQFQSLQQNLNQIASICNQLSQNEQANVSKLSQIQQAEKTASQQLQQCVQMCNQVAQQMQQLSSTQLSSGIGQFPSPGAGQYSAGAGQHASMPTGGGFATGNWSNIPVSTSNASMGSPTGQYGFETSKELGATGQAAFNTNKDLGK